MTTTLTTVPTTIIAGDSLAIVWTHTDYPRSAGWSASLALAGPSVLAITATLPATDADGHAFTITTAQSDALAPGNYSYRIRCTLSTVTTTAESGVCTVRPDLAALVDGENISYAQRMLQVCRDARESILRGETKMYMIGGRQTMFHSLAEVAKEEAHWLLRVQVEEGKGFGTPIRYSFRSAVRSA